MYDNIGKKIKLLAKIIFIIESIASVIIGAAVGSQDEEFILLGLLIMLIGPLFAWVSSWLLYGFGELIDKTCDIARNTRGNDIKSEAQALADSQRIGQLEKLRSQGLITEEEYQQARTKQQ